MQQTVEALQDEVAVLREELAGLRLDVARLRRAVERPQTVPGYLPEGSLASEVRSEASFSGIGGANVSVRSLGSSVGSTIQTGIGEEQYPQPVLSWAQRERIAQGIGAFFQRSLAGDHRGTSGREHLRLASRLWVVVRSIHGEVFSPVRIFRSWARAKEVVKIGSSAGDSIFVGLPSEREARICVEAAGLLYPDQLEG